MKLKGILSSTFLIGVVCLSSCNTSSFSIYLMQCTDDSHGEEGHLIEVQDTEEFYHMAIYDENEEGASDTNDKETVVLLIYDNVSDCSDCKTAQADANYFAKENNVDIYKYGPYYLGEDGKNKLDVRSYEWIYKASCWNGTEVDPDWNDALPEYKEGEGDNFDLPLPVFYIFNNTKYDNGVVSHYQETGVMRIGTTDYLGYFESHFGVIDSDGNIVNK